MKKKQVYLIIIFLIVASLATFGRIVGNDFINFDDDMYIIENNFIKSGITFTSVRWALVTHLSSMWQPITWISLMLDWSFFGSNASGYHLVSLILHIGAVIFLFLFLYRTTNHLWPSAFASVFFALHPLRVESVAWATERKDVLSMFFGMAALCAYSFYVERLKKSHYFICLILFTLALMSKAMLITLPFVMLLIDYWPLGRFRPFSANNGFKATGRLLWEKVPFFTLSIASGSITVWAQYEDNTIHQALPLRVTNAIVSYVSYLKKTFLPVDLAAFYPFVYSFPLWHILASTFILIGITVFVVYYLKKMPFLTVGWFWYLGTLVPVSGFIPVNQPMADHYTYLPSIGIAMMLAWGIPFLIKNEESRKKILFPAGTFAIAILAALTWQQCAYWKNSIKIWNHTLQATNSNFLAYSRLGNAYGRVKQYQKSIDNFNEVIRIRPDYEIAYNGKGVSYNAMGMHRRAIDEFNKAININPAYTDAYNNKALSYFMLGDKISGCRDARKSCTLGMCKTLEAAAIKGLCR